MHPTAPHMPEVDVIPDLSARFEMAWRDAAGDLHARGGETGKLPGFLARLFRRATGNAITGGRHVVVVTPGRMLAYHPCPAPGSMAAGPVEAIETLVPPSAPLGIAVIAFTEQAAMLAGAASAIPFFGYLIGMAYIGHSVVVFEGHPSALEAGCRGADLLIADGGMVPSLQKDWVAAARRVMRGSRVLVFGRDGSVGEAPGAA